MRIRNRIATAAAVLVAVGSAGQARAEFQPGAFFSWSQDSWGAAPAPGNAAQQLLDYFDIAYGGGAVEVGIHGSGGYSMAFTSAFTVLDYLPASGSPSPLNSDLLDPSSSSSGVFGGVVLALQLDVDFSDAGYLNGSVGVTFGDLILVNMSDIDIGVGFFLNLPAFEGLSIRDSLAR